MKQKRVIGYDFCAAGLNNQKAAFIGLVLTAKKIGASICLPYLCDYNTRTNGNSGKVPFELIFDSAAYSAVLDEYEVEVVTEPYQKVDFNEMFRVGGTPCRTAALSGSDPLVPALLRALRPSPSLAKKIARTSELVVAQGAVDLACQLRIEIDWVKHVKENFSYPIDEEQTVSFERIMSKIFNTFGSDIQRIFVTCDDSALMVKKDIIAEVTMRKFGYELIWKQETADLSLETQFIERSAIDFEIALNMQRFVGNSRSTFSNLLMVTKTLLDNSGHWSHYIYNYRSEQVVLRRDRGHLIIPSQVVAL